MSALVYCETHNPRDTAPVAHVETPSCVWPHYVAPRGTELSMVAAETFDQREAVAV